MKEKEPKSPILVFATILFLSLFIILPPVFRKFLPEKVEKKEEKVVKHSLYCEKISISEKMKVTTNISYENDIAVKNVMTFIVYTPTDEDVALDDGTVYEKTIQDEISYLKSLNGVDVLENASQTVISLDRKVLDVNKEEVEVNNYLSETSVALSHFESEGYTCTKNN